MDDRLKKIQDSAYGPVEFEHDKFGNLSGATYNDFHKLWRAPQPNLAGSPGDEHIGTARR
ncbi:MAG: hypothetical protein IPO40_22105 [Fibrobacteres bacterium]|nr:hypothetical protein [Fibrobacterota bacterium]